METHGVVVSNVAIPIGILKAVQNVGDEKSEI
jgi:hypothetical protein